ncbi:MAG: hypothetical protein HND53_10775 [Proteobacteria bacterium]|nr:hypothetical protein [Pseudomonadota bacterium]NOG60975.1 hypothetical protein [Pseudomonadota bacterium]
MSVRKLFILISITISSIVLLSACSDDSGTSSKPAATAAPEPAPTSDGNPLSMDSIEKADGVVYQDEIYANWPYNQD